MFKIIMINKIRFFLFVFTVFFYSAFLSGFNNLPEDICDAVAVFAAEDSENNEEKLEEGKKEVKSQRFFYDLYFRVMGRYDMGHGSDTLGWWQFYGRLLNETNWIKLGLGVQILQPDTKSDGSIKVYARIEGNSFRTGEGANGNLSQFSITQFYLESENIPVKNFVVQAGTLWYDMGYISIYDFYAAQTFWETVGIRAGQRFDKLEWFLGLGDSGFNIMDSRKKIYPEEDYSTVITVGGLLKVNAGALRSSKFADKFWLGLSFMGLYEPGFSSNKNTPHQTSGIDYKEILRGDVIENYVINNPGDPDALLFDSRHPVHEVSKFYWRVTAWLGSGSMKIGGPVSLKWNNLSLSMVQHPPERKKTFSYNQIEKEIHYAEYTDERFELTITDECSFILWPGRLDMVLGSAFGYSWDNDNKFRPDDYNRFIFSLVLRPQYYIIKELHLLLEGSVAIEKSTIGNRYREHYDSIQENINGSPDVDGLEWGDADTKYTVQIKCGLVFNPFGRGIYNRPSIRLLYGVQYSNVHAAFGNSYNESLTRQNRWNKFEDIHWHHVVSLEAEAWLGN